MESPFAPRHDQVTEACPRQLAFENRSVRVVLERFDLSQHASELIQRFRDKWGQPRLTFESFFEEFPTFPLLLEAHSFYGVAAKARPAALFRSFDETFFLRRYLDVHARAQAEGDSRPVGMVMPFDGYQGGMVIHDGSFPTPGTKLIHELADGVLPARVTVEPFISLTNHLVRKGWTPDTRLVARKNNSDAPKRSSSLFPAWLVAWIGTGPDMIIFSFLLRVLRCARSSDGQLIRVNGNHRFVVIDQEDLADRAGLSPRQVARGVQSLKSHGVIATKRALFRGRVQTHFLVNKSAVRHAKNAHLGSS